MSIYIILSAIDMLAGLMILVRARAGFALFLFGTYMLVKGAWSLFSSVSSGYWLDWMGFVDMLAGLCLMLLYAGLAPKVFITLGAIAIAKGAYSLVRSAMAAK